MGTGSTSPDYLLLGSSAQITCLAFARFSQSSGSQFLVSGTQSGDVSCWSLKTRRVIALLNEAHKSAVLSVVPLNVDCSQLAESVLTQGRDGVVQKWKVENNGLLWTKDVRIPCQSLNFCRISLSWLGSLGALAVPSPSESPEISIYYTDNMSSGPAMKVRPESENRKFGLLMDLAISCQTVEGLVHLFGGFEDGSVVAWIFRMDQQGTAFKVGDNPTIVLHEKFHNETLMSLDFCPKTYVGYSASADGLVVGWSIVREEHEGKQDFKMNMRTSKKMGSGIGCLRCRPDGRLVAMANWDRGVTLVGAKKLKYLGEIDLHEEMVSCLCFDSSTKELALGCHDNMISVWSLYKDV